MSDKPLISWTISPMFLLFLVFLVLQLTGVITWSWWWVTAPLWIPIAAFFVIWAAIIIFYIATAIVAGIFDLLS